MINNIELNGFKSFKYANIDLRPFTLLTGLNNSGKSSVIQSLLMADKCMNQHGQFLLQDHGSAKELTNPSEDKFSICVTNNNKRLVMTGSNPPKISTDFTMPRVFYVEAGREGGKSSIRTYNDSDEMASNGENILKCIDTYGDEIIPSSLKHPDSQGDTLLFNLQAWLNIISPNVEFTYEIQKLSDSSFSMYDEHRAPNVGFGLSYTLPVITAILRTSLIPGSMLLIENPEAHLHPNGQTEMGKLIAKATMAGVQVVVETHSDHLFDGIRIFTKEKPEFCNQFICYWFERDKYKFTTASPVLINEKGKVTTSWPQGFFDQFETNAMQLI